MDARVCLALLDVQDASILIHPVVAGGGKKKLRVMGFSFSSPSFSDFFLAVCMCYRL